MLQLTESRVYNTCTKQGSNQQSLEFAEQENNLSPQVSIIALPCYNVAFYAILGGVIWLHKLQKQAKSI